LTHDTLSDILHTARETEASFAVAQQVYLVGLWRAFLTEVEVGASTHLVRLQEDAQSSLNASKSSTLIPEQCAIL